MLVGIDEVGRGCLAGPVVACAVILPDGYYNPDIKDSKKLSASKRDKLSLEIHNVAVGIGIGVVCSRVIDSAGIVPATKQAMHFALSRVGAAYSRVVVDAVKLNNLSCEETHPFKAEDLYPCVAAASIVAKVYRDSLMDRLSLIYDKYGWQKNKGYGTKAHLDAIASYGITPLHRVSFLKNYIK